MPIPVAFRRNARRAKVFTIIQLAAWLSCSVPTARRRLGQYGALTSYSHRGSYYTLPEIPQFDEHGLWQYRRIHFSTHGNLKQTVVHLVSTAPTGLTGRQIERIVGLPAKSFLAHMRDHPLLTREKVNARFVWLAADAQSRQGQLHRRRDDEQAAGLPSLALADAVVVLVELLTAPHLHPNELSERVRARAPTASPEAIERFFLHHGIKAAKKGAADFR